MRTSGTPYTRKWLISDLFLSPSDSYCPICTSEPRLELEGSNRRFWGVGCSPGLSPAYGFEHPASTLPTRFPAALGIGHGSLRLS